MSELKRCPFCGNEAEINVVKTYQGQTAKIVCSGCSCRKTIIKPYNYTGDIEADVINAWNTRRPMEKVVERMKESAFMVAVSKLFYDNPQNGENVDEVVTLREAIRIVEETEI